MRCAAVLWFLFAVSATGGTDPLYEDWDLMAWDHTAEAQVWALGSVNHSTDVNLSVGANPVVDLSVRALEEEALVSSYTNYSSYEDAEWNHSSDEDDVWRPVGNASLDATENLFDLAFSQQERDVYERLNALFDDLVGLPNRTSTWGFAVFVTLAPLRCSEVKKVAVLFDAAMRESNPDSEITSVATRLGAAVCDADGECPCKDARRYSQRVMELRSTSNRQALQPPRRFPYPVQITST